MRQGWWSLGMHPSFSPYTNWNAYWTLKFRWVPCSFNNAQATSSVSTSLARSNGYFQWHTLLWNQLLLFLSTHSFVLDCLILKIKASKHPVLAQSHPRQLASSATLLWEPKILHLPNLLVFPLQLTLYHILFQLCVDGILNSVQKPDIMRCNQRYCHTTTPSSSCTAHAVDIILGKIRNCVI